MAVGALPWTADAVGKYFSPWGDNDVVGESFSNLASQISEDTPEDDVSFVRIVQIIINDEFPETADASAIAKAVDRLGRFLIRESHFTAASGLYASAIKLSINYSDGKRALLYHRLGQVLVKLDLICDAIGEWEQALVFYEKESSCHVAIPGLCRELAGKLIEIRHSKQAKKVVAKGQIVYERIMEKMDAAGSDLDALHRRLEGLKRKRSMRTELLNTTTKRRKKDGTE